MSTQDFKIQIELINKITESRNFDLMKKLLPLFQNNNSDMEKIIMELESSFNQVKAMKDGKIEKQSVNDFLDEL